MAKEKKTATQSTHKYRRKPLGSRTQAGTTCEEASALTPPTKGLLPSPLESF